MCAAPLRRPSDERWSVGHPTTIADPVCPHLHATTASSHEQLEAFLQERLDHWDVEAAEIICTWGRVGDMCSPDFQSQLRGAQTTLQTAQKSKEHQRELTAIRAQQDAQTATRRRHRDQLAAAAHSRAEAKVKAALRQRQREEQKKNVNGDGGRSASSVMAEGRQQLEVKNNRTPVNVAPSSVMLSKQSERTVTPRRASTGAANSYEKPAPPSVARTSAVLPVRKHEHGSNGAAGGSPHFEAAAVRSVVNDVRRDYANSRSSSSSSSLTLNSDNNRDCSDSTDNGATHASLGESFSGTFVVRRMLMAHVYSTQVLRHTILHHSPVKVGHPSNAVASRAQRTEAVSADSPAPHQAPQSLLSWPQRRRSSSKTTVVGTANSSLSPVDPSLPVAEDEVTAIFASRSRSQEKASPQRGSGSRGINATAEFISPIKDTHQMHELSSLSSAGSYMWEENGCDE